MEMEQPQGGTGPGKPGENHDRENQGRTRLGKPGETVTGNQQGTGTGKPGEKQIRETRSFPGVPPAVGPLGRMVHPKE